jgi:hypothetical protein
MAETKDGTGKDEKAAVVAAIEPTTTGPSKVKKQKIICFKKEQKNSNPVLFSNNSFKL